VVSIDHEILLEARRAVLDNVDINLPVAMIVEVERIRRGGRVGRADSADLVAFECWASRVPEYAIGNACLDDRSRNLRRLLRF
jgi:hypothetical protein